MEVLVKVFDNEALAQLWAGILREEGIPSMVRPTGSGVGKIYFGSFIPHALYVMPKDEEQARALLDEAEAAGT